MSFVIDVEDEGMDGVIDVLQHFSWGPEDLGRLRAFLNDSISDYSRTEMQRFYRAMREED